MMDLPDYVSNVQEGMSQFVSDTTSMYNDMSRRYATTMQPQAGGAAAHANPQPQPHPHPHPSDCRCRECDCDDCHCECCVCDADILVHGRCGETRRIPVTFDNDTRHERQVKLTLDKFVSAGGRDLGWDVKLSESEFTLRGCDHHTIVVTVSIRCDAFQPANPAGTRNEQGAAVDRCEVGYGTLRAEGCVVRPIVLAVAVLPDDCDAYRRPCGCDCCCH